jgi:hypothetical protein
MLEIWMRLLLGMASGGFDKKLPAVKSAAPI